MAMQAASTEPSIGVRVPAFAPEQSLAVASLLTMSGGFLDAFTWLSLGGVFASSQTGNVVFLGVYAMSGQWQQAAHHVLPIVGFLLGASLAVRIRAPLLCLAGEIGCLMVIMLLHDRMPEMIAIPGLAFGAALQSASFRQVEHWKYLSVTVTGNMLRAIEQSAAASDRDARRGVGVSFLLCVLFLSGAAVGTWATKWLGACCIVLPVATLACALWLCRPSRRFRASTR